MSQRVVDLLPYLYAFVLAGLLSAAAGFVELWPWRRSVGLHWTERARRLHPARGATLVNHVLSAAVAALAMNLWRRHTSLPGLGVAAYLGALLGVYPGERAQFPAMGFRTWLHLALVAVVMRSLRWLTLLVAALVMPVTLTVGGWAVAIATFGLHLGLAFGVGSWVLRGLGVLRPPCAKLQMLVADTSVALGVPVSRVWLLTSPMANAWAVATTRELWFTTTLLDVLSDDEVKAVCAHELGHLSEPPWAKVVRVAGTLLTFPAIFVRPLYVCWGPTGSPRWLD